MFSSSASCFDLSDACLFLFVLNMFSDKSSKAYFGLIPTGLQSCICLHTCYKSVLRSLCLARSPRKSANFSTKSTPCLISSLFSLHPGFFPHGAIVFFTRRLHACLQHFLFFKSTGLKYLASSSDELISCGTTRSAFSLQLPPELMPVLEHNSLLFADVTVLRPKTVLASSWAHSLLHVVDHWCSNIQFCLSELHLQLLPDRPLFQECW